MSNHDITAADVQAVLKVEDLFPAGIELDRYAADQAIAAETAQIAETRMGVDGHMVAGYTPAIYVVKLNFEANSPAAESLAQVLDASAANRRIYMCELVVTIPSIRTVLTWKNGVLQSGTLAPAVKKVLDPTEWTLHFEAFERSAAS
jgi:hypothetical protein